MLGRLLKIPYQLRGLIWLIACAICATIYPKQGSQYDAGQKEFTIVLFLTATAVYVCTLLPKQARATRGWIWFKCRRWFFEKFLSTATTGLIAAIVGSYNTIESIWGKKWKFFTDHTDLHDRAKFWSCMILLGLGAGLFFKEKWKERSLSETEHLLRDFMEMVARIVQHKISLLARQAKLSPNLRRQDTHDYPLDQLGAIFTESAGFLEKIFKLRADQVDLTILQRKNEEPWSFLLAHQKKWKHSPVSDLFINNSCAANVLSSGQHIFHASKSIAAEDGEYRVGKWDAQKGDGSIFCDLVEIQSSTAKWNFIVSIVTYGEHFCDPQDKINEGKVLGLLHGIMRRIELELHLKVMNSK
jgi:hypothetical protein